MALSLAVMAGGADAVRLRTRLGSDWEGASSMGDDFNGRGVHEAEVAFDQDEITSPHDPRAEQVARESGMPEDMIAMIKEGLEDSRAGRFSPSSEVFARLAKRYGR